MYHPPPATLPAFPGAVRSKPKTAVQGGGGLRKRWKEADGRIFEWDSRHGTVEVYDAKGKHLGEFDPATGRQLKGGNPNYAVEP
jgi:hypothetical protein